MYFTYYITIFTDCRYADDFIRHIFNFFKIVIFSVGQFKFEK